MPAIASRLNRQIASLKKKGIATCKRISVCIKAPKIARNRQAQIKPAIKTAKTLSPSQEIRNKKLWR